MYAIRSYYGITSYSIHYTKLYDLAPLVIARINTERSFFQFKDSVQENRVSLEIITALQGAFKRHLINVITSYSIHYTKLYEPECPIQLRSWPFLPDKKDFLPPFREQRVSNPKELYWISTMTPTYPVPQRLRGPGAKLFCGQRRCVSPVDSWIS